MESLERKHRFKGLPNTPWRTLKARRGKGSPEIDPNDATCVLPTQKTPFNPSTMIKKEWSIDKSSSYCSYDESTETCDETESLEDAILNISTINACAQKKSMDSDDLLSYTSTEYCDSNDTDDSNDSDDADDSNDSDDTDASDDIDNSDDADNSEETDDSDDADNSKDSDEEDTVTDDDTHLEMRTRKIIKKCDSMTLTTNPKVPSNVGISNDRFVGPSLVTASSSRDESIRTGTSESCNESSCNSSACVRQEKSSMICCVNDFYDNVPVSPSKKISTRKSSYPKTIHFESGHATVPNESKDTARRDTTATPNTLKWQPFMTNQVGRRFSNFVKLCRSRKSVKDKEEELCSVSIIQKGLNDVVP